MGTLNAYNSLYYQLHPSALDLIVAIDRDLASVLIPVEDRKASWALYIGLKGGLPSTTSSSPKKSLRIAQKGIVQQRGDDSLLGLA